MRASARDAVLSSLHAMDARDASVGAIAVRLGASALTEAEQVDARTGAPRFLEGVPYVVKGNYDVAGHVTRCNSQVADETPATRDAEAIQRLREAGAILVGITVMSEWAYGGARGGRQPPARNPHDTARYAGGSSGGSAAAVAAGYVPVALGSDTAGSIRVPSAWCGVVGFKPSYAKASLAGVRPLAPSLDHVGIVAREVAGAARVAAALGIVDRPPDARERGVRDLRIGVLDAGSQAPGQRALGTWLARLRAAGATVEALPPLDLASIHRCSMTILMWEASRSLAHVHNSGNTQAGALLHARLDEAARVSDEAYRNALLDRGKLVSAVDAVARRYDIVVSATTTSAAPRLVDLVEPSRLPPTPLLPFSLAGMPALSMPCATDAEGMPFGAQVAIPAGADGELLAIAAALEAATGPCTERSIP